MHLFRFMALTKAILICAALSSWQTPVFAEIITVPFGWKAGQTRVYHLSTIVERLGKHNKGDNCTLNGLLRVEIMRRDKTSARVRFLLTAFKFEKDCAAPSFRQLMWLHLSDVPVIVDMEPVSGKVFAPEAHIIRDSFFHGLEQSKSWIGRSFPPALRKEIAERFRVMMTSDDWFVSNAGFVEPLIYAVGGNYDTQSNEVRQADIPSPFGGGLLPATFTFTTKASTPTSHDFTLTVVTIYDQKAVKEAMKVMFIKVVANKASPAEAIKYFDTVNIDAGSTVIQRIERLTGWTIDSEIKITRTYNEGTEIDLTKLVYLPGKK